MISTGQIYVSTNFGSTWTSTESSRDFRSISVSASGQYQTAVVYGGKIYISKEVLSNNSVTTNILADGAVTTAKIATNAVQPPIQFTTSFSSYNAGAKGDMVVDTTAGTLSICSQSGNTGAASWMSFIQLS